MNSHAADDIYRPVPLMPVLPKTPTSLYMAMALFSICAPALDDVVGPERVSFQRVVFEIHLLTCRQLLSRRIVCSALGEPAILPLLCSLLVIPTFVNVQDNCFEVSWQA